MLSFLNKKFKFLLILILAIIGISFIFFGQWTPREGVAAGGGVIAKIDGRNIKAAEYFAEVRAVRVMYTMQTGQLAPDTAQADRFFRMQAWNRLLVLAAAKRAGIDVDEEQAMAFLVKHPFFLGEDGKFSDEAYKNFRQRILQPYGIDEKHFIRLIREQLAYEQMVQSIAGTVVVQPAEVQTAIEKLYGKASVRYVEIAEADIRKGLNPTAEELQTFFNATAAEFALPETRAVEYVKFLLTPEQAALPAAERAAAMQELGKKAYEFTGHFFAAHDAGTPLPNFAETATAAGLQAVAAQPFTGNTPLIEKDDLGLRLAAAAFNLTAESPISDYLPVADGFIVLHLTNITPSQPRPYEAVQAEVLKKYLDLVTASRLVEQAKAVAVNLRAALAEGKTWEQAAAANSLKPQTLPDLVPGETDRDGKNPLLDTAAGIATQLAVGDVSDPVRSPAGAVLFYLAGRVNPDAEKIEQVEPAVRAQIEQMRRQQIIGDWVNSLLKAPKTNIPPAALAADRES